MLHEQAEQPPKDGAKPEQLSQGELSAIYAAIGEAVPVVDEDRLHDILATFERGPGRRSYYLALEALQVIVPQTQDGFYFAGELTVEEMLREAWLTSIPEEEIFKRAAEKGLPVREIRTAARARFEKDWDNLRKTKFLWPTMSEDKEGIAAESELVEVLVELSRATEEIGCSEVRDILSAVMCSAGFPRDPDGLFAAFLGFARPKRGMEFLGSLPQPDLLRLAWAATLGEDTVVEKAWRFGVNIERVLEQRLRAADAKSSQE